MVQQVQLSHLLLFNLSYTKFVHATSCSMTGSMGRFVVQTEQNNSLSYRHSLLGLIMGTVTADTNYTVPMILTHHHHHHNLVPITTTIMKAITHYLPKACTILNIKEVITITEGTPILHQHYKHLNGLC
jgi:hypothetical protein